MLIYKIRNIVNNKVYVGLSKHKDENKRWKQHIKALNKNKHNNHHLQKDWNKYGGDCFEFTVIKRYKNITVKKLGEYEKYYIDKYSKKYKTYNISKGGCGGRKEPLPKILKNKKHEKIKKESATRQVNEQKYSFEIEEYANKYRIYWKYEGMYILTTKNKDTALKIIKELQNKKSLNKDNIKKITKSILGKIAQNKRKSKKEEHNPPTLELLGYNKFGDAVYDINRNGKWLKRSVNKQELINWFSNKYPNEKLINNT